MAGGGDKKGGGIPVTDYFMSIQVGLCHGPVDAIQRIVIRDKEAWVGQQVGEGAIFVNKPELFGGNKKEGGVRGIAYFMPGSQSQVLPEGLAQRLGLTSADAPAGRGRASIWFVGGVANTTGFGGRYQGFSDINPVWNGSNGGGSTLAIGGGGFMWGSNNPYMAAWEVTLSRHSAGLPLATAWIPNTVTFPKIEATGKEGDDDYVPEVPARSFQWPDSNPIHIIYECMTNEEWGMSHPSNLFNMPLWIAAAQTLFDEKFGLSLQWTQQARIQDFVQEITDHIQAYLFVNPRNGLWEIKLARFDYDPDTLPRLGPDDCTVSNIQRKAIEETINEVVVTWTNPITEDGETVQQQDIANISLQGAIVSDSRNYYGIRRPDLAAQVAARDLRSASAPLISCNVEVNRKGWTLTPGECFKLDWPEDGIEGLIVRIGDVDYGKPGDHQIKMPVLEDIFSLTTAAFYQPPQSQWVDDEREPVPLPFVEIMTTPYALMRQAGFGVADDDYPAVGSIVLGASAQAGVNEFELSSPQTQANGDERWEPLGSMATASHAFLAAPLAREAVSQVTGFRNITGAGEGPVVNGFVLIGRGEDVALELALIRGFANGTFELMRGALDTVPRAWPAGTHVWFLNENTRATDESERAPGEISYKLQPRTSGGLLPFAQTPVTRQLLTDRPYLPQRPANVSVAGVTFATKTYDAPPTEVPVAWATRNRLLEDTVFPAWTDASNAPEDGQTTKIEIVDLSSREVLTTHTGLTGTSFTIPVESFKNHGSTLVRFLSERDGLTSLQGFAVPVEIKGFSGYGNSYGLYYGE